MYVFFSFIGFLYSVQYRKIVMFRLILELDLHGKKLSRHDKENNQDDQDDQGEYSTQNTREN